MAYTAGFLLIGTLFCSKEAIQLHLMGSALFFNLTYIFTLFTDSAVKILKIFTILQTFKSKIPLNIQSPKHTIHYNVLLNTLNPTDSLPYPRHTNTNYRPDKRNTVLLLNHSTTTPDACSLCTLSTSKIYKTRSS